MIRAAFLLDRRRNASGTPAATANATSRTRGRWDQPSVVACGLVPRAETVRASPSRPCDGCSLCAISAMTDSGSGCFASARMSVPLWDEIAEAAGAAASGSRCRASAVPASEAAARTFGATSVAARLTTGAAVAVVAAEVDSVADDDAEGVAAAATGLEVSSTAGVSSDTGDVAAGSAEPPLSAVATGTVSTPTDGVDAIRGGSKLRGSMYPCGSLVTRAPKYT